MYVPQPASTPGTSAAIDLPASSSTVRIGAASTGSSERDSFSPMIENVAIDNGM